ncbi:unnamed protein product, partial [Closterium sp. NIES-54]
HLGPSAPAAALTTAATATATATTAAPTYSAPMASLRVLVFDHEGIPILFDTWLDDLQLYLLSDSKDSVSLFDLALGAATAPPAIADSATRSQCLTRDAAARLAIRNHLPFAECAHFGQHKTAQALYAVVPPMFITLYFIVTCLPDSLCSVRDHFLSLDPTSLTSDLLEQHLLAAETSAVAVGDARGTPRPPFFEGCSPSPFAHSYVSVAEDVGADSASAKRHSSKGQGGRDGGGGSGGDYATALVAESASASPPSVRVECALDKDVLEDRQEDFECLVAPVPRFASMLVPPEGDPDAPDIPTPSSYAEAITDPYSSQ